MTYSQERVETLIYQLLEEIGENPKREGLIETPARVARAFAEIFGGTNSDPSKHLRKTFGVETDGLVLVRDIDFCSMCEHHLLPFRGKIHVAYLPACGRVVGLSKLARCIDGYAARLQVQESFTNQVADAVETSLSTKGVAVIVEAEHMCMTMRGVLKNHSTTVTSQFRGALAEPEHKQEILDMIGR